MEHEIIHWFCRRKSSSFSFPPSLSSLYLPLLSVSGWKKQNLTELNQRFTQGGARLTWSRAGTQMIICRTLDMVTSNLPDPTDCSHLLPLSVPWFPRTHSYLSYSWFWPQFTCTKCCNITREGRGAVRRWRHTHTHTHTHTHSRFRPAVQLADSRCFAQFYSFVMHFSYAVVFQFNHNNLTHTHTHTYTHIYAQHVREKHVNMAVEITHSHTGKKWGGVWRRVSMRLE